MRKKRRRREEEKMGEEPCLYRHRTASTPETQVAVTIMGKKSSDDNTHTYTHAKIDMYRKKSHRRAGLC